MDAEYKALVLECVKKTTMLKELNLGNAELSPAETSDVLRTLLNTDSVNDLEQLFLDRAANFGEDSSCELMCTLIDRAHKLKECFIGG